MVEMMPVIPWIIRSGRAYDNRVIFWYDVALSAESG